MPGKASLTRRPYPILEFDPSRQALIDPAPRRRGQSGAPEHCVVCFFAEVVARLARDPKAKRLAKWKWEDGPHILYEIEWGGKRLAFIQPGLGGPLSAGLLEDTIAMGCRKFIVCGGAGALDAGLGLGSIIVPTAAVRDEGTSYHYLAPSREAKPSAKAVAAIKRVLRRHGVKYAAGKTWTTDAPFRETRARIALRRSEGCLTVEMEAASLFAVARFRKVVLAQMLYAGDDVSGAKWSHRNWQSQKDTRRRIFELAAEACLAL